jgi:hypothetical protein
MSSPVANEVGAEEARQDIREQQLVNRFDYFTIRDGPHRGAVILRFVGFGTVTLVGIDPEVARIGDIVVEIAHSGFHMRAEVWLRVRNGADGWTSISQLQTQYYYASYLA